MPRVASRASFASRSFLLAVVAALTVPAAARVGALAAPRLTAPLAVSAAMAAAPPLPPDAAATAA